MKPKYLCLFSSILFLLGCDDFLSHEPDNRTEINNVEKITELLVSAYPEANYITFCEAMTDNVSEQIGGFTDPTNTQPYFWEDVSETTQDSPEFYWQACYSAIAAANHALATINEAENPSQYNAQKGEALLARAYSHFMLVNLFAKPYNEETASTDPGIPYVTEPETVALKTYERRTVEFVYDMIERDIRNGIPLINDEIYDVPSYHFTKAAAHAFATRFYLFRGEFDKVIEHAAFVFSDNNPASKLRPWNTTYQTYNFDVLEANYTRATEPANLLISETASLWARTYNRFRYSTGIDDYDRLTEIEDMVGGNLAYTIYINSQASIYFVVKFREHFVREDISADIGLAYTIVPLLTTDEVLLSRAEAYAYEGRYNEAIADLNQFFSTRILEYDQSAHNLTISRMNQYYGTSNTLAALIETILQLRRVEFLHEGLWWFDIRRYNIPVTHLSLEEGIVELPADDPRRVLQIPREAIELGGLAPNPR